MLPIWGGVTALTATVSQGGALDQPADGADSVRLENPPPGSDAEQLSGTSGTTGIALIEVYLVP